MRQPACTDFVSSSCIYSLGKYYCQWMVYTYVYMICIRFIHDSAISACICQLKDKEGKINSESGHITVYGSGQLKH